MDPIVVLSTLGLVALAELPDKTMIATLIMGSRLPPLPVWLGACGAFLVHAAVAVTAGRLLELLPHRVLEAVVTAVFLAGAAYLLVVPERHERHQGSAEAQRAEASGFGRLVPAALGGAFPRAVGTAFSVILVAEFGDITQILTANLVARTHQAASVFVGSAAALCAVAAVAAFSGRALVRVVPVTLVRRLGGLVLLGLSAWSLYAAVTA